MPTTRPRYQVTDSGEVRELLDAAQERWPEIPDRKGLLIALARRGAETLAAETERSGAEERRTAQRRAFAEVRERIDVDVLLGDDAWR